MPAGMSIAHEPQLARQRVGRGVAFVDHAGDPLAAVGGVEPGERGFHRFAGHAWPQWSL